MMLRPKHVRLSTTGKYGLTFIALYILATITIAVTPFVLARMWKADAVEQRTVLSLLQKRAGQAARSSAVGSVQKSDIMGVLVPGDTTGIAAAEMQHRISGWADKSGLTINRMQSANVTQSGRAVSLELELEAKGKIEELQDFLYEVESGKPLVMVKDASISVADSGAADGSNPSQQISVRLTLEASSWLGGT